MTCEGDARWSSIITLDTRNARMVSPFQAWLVKEIMTNSASSINVLTERDHVMPPTSGYHLSLFANYTLDGLKAAIAISVDSNTGVPRRGWDTETARMLAHEAFQPFSWPVLRDSSPSYTDVKIYIGNEILFHWIFRGFRADTDLSVQQQFADEFFIRDVCKGRVRSLWSWPPFQAGASPFSPSSAEVRCTALVRKALSLLEIRLARGSSSVSAIALLWMRSAMMRTEWNFAIPMPITGLM